MNDNKKKEFLLPGYDKYLEFKRGHGGLSERDLANFWNKYLKANFPNDPFTDYTEEELLEYERQNPTKVRFPAINLEKARNKIIEYDPTYLTIDEIESVQKMDPEEFLFKYLPSTRQRMKDEMARTGIKEHGTEEYLKGIGSNLARGATLGFSDLLSEGMSARAERFEKKHPYAAMVANIVGGILPFVGTGGTGAAIKAATMAGKSPTLLKVINSLSKTAPASIIEGISSKIPIKGFGGAVTKGALAGIPMGGLYNANINYHTDKYDKINGENNKYSDNFISGAIDGAVVGAFTPFVGAALSKIPNSLSSLKDKILNIKDKKIVKSNALSDIKKEALRKIEERSKNIANKKGADVLNRKLISRNIILEDVIDEANKLDPAFQRFYDAHPSLGKSGYLKDSLSYKDLNQKFRNLNKEDLDVIEQYASNPHKILDSNSDSLKGFDKRFEKSFKEGRKEATSELYEKWNDTTYDLLEHPDVLDTLYRLTLPESKIRNFIYPHSDNAELKKKVGDFYDTLSQVREIRESINPIAKKLNAKEAQNLLKEELKKANIDLNVSGDVLDVIRHANESRIRDLSQYNIHKDKSILTKPEWNYLELRNLYNKNFPEFNKAQKKYEIISRDSNVSEKIKNNLFKPRVSLEDFREDLYKIYPKEKLELFLKNNKRFGKSANKLANSLLEEEILMKKPKDRISALNDIVDSSHTKDKLNYLTKNKIDKAAPYIKKLYNTSKDRISSFDSKNMGIEDIIHSMDITYPKHTLVKKALNYINRNNNKLFFDLVTQKPDEVVKILEKHLKNKRINKELYYNILRYMSLPVINDNWHHRNNKLFEKISPRTWEYYIENKND